MRRNMRQEPKKPRDKSSVRNVLTVKKPGSRQNEAKLKSESQVVGTAKDPRHGSKKAIALTVETPVKAKATPKPQQPKLTDQQRLLQLEEDPRPKSAFRSVRRRPSFICC